MVRSKDCGCKSQDCGRRAKRKIKTRQGLKTRAKLSIYIQKMANQQAHLINGRFNKKIGSKMVKSVIISYILEKFAR